MSPRLKWGLITGMAVALLNLCGGSLVGAINNCCSFITVILAASLSGYFCGRQEPAGEAVKAGAIAGAIVGGFNLVSQVIGGLLGGLIGQQLMASIYPQLGLNPDEYAQAAGLGFVFIVIAAVVVGVVLLLVGAGAGALAAKLALPDTGTG